MEQLKQKKLITGRHRRAVSMTLDPRLVNDLDIYSKELGCTRSMITEIVLRRELYSVMQDIRKMIVGRSVLTDVHDGLFNTPNIETEDIKNNG